MRLAKLGLVVTLAFTTVFLAQALMTANYAFRNVGTVKAVGVGVYWDAMCTQNVSLIEWGLLSPGESKKVTVYVKNEANTMATLSLSTGNWDPPNASDYIMLSWDYAGQTLAPNAVLPVCLTLSVSPDIWGIEDFSFDIIITSQG